ncbi:MAG: phosphatidylglycerophosphatase A [Pseudomonadales bacterium]
MSDTPASLTLPQLRSLPVFLATGFGSGLMRPAPGTWGSLAGLVIWFFLLAPLSPIKQLLIIIAVFWIGVWACNRIEQRYGLHDPGAIVIDEFVGVWIALLGFGPYWIWALAGFALFRLFDITKPGIVGWADQSLKGGFGVMADDVLAGCLAAIVLQVAFWVSLFARGTGFS